MDKQSIQYQPYPATAPEWMVGKMTKQTRALTDTEVELDDWDNGEKKKHIAHSNINADAKSFNDYIYNISYSI